MPLRALINVIYRIYHFYYDILFIWLKTTFLTFYFNAILLYYLKRLRTLNRHPFCSELSSRDFYSEVLTGAGLVWSVSLTSAFLELSCNISLGNICFNFVFILTATHLHHIYGQHGNNDEYAKGAGETLFLLYTVITRDERHFHIMTITTRNLRNIWSLYIQTNPRQYKWWTTMSIEMTLQLHTVTSRNKTRRKQ